MRIILIFSIQKTNGRATKQMLVCLCIVCGRLVGLLQQLGGGGAGCDAALRGGGAATARGRQHQPARRHRLELPHRRPHLALRTAHQGELGELRRWNREPGRPHCCCVGVQVTVAAARGAGSLPCAARPGWDYTGSDLAAVTADSLALCVARCQATIVCQAHITALQAQLGLTVASVKLFSVKIKSAD